MNHVEDSRHLALEAGAYLYRAGDTSTEMFLIREGEVELLKSVAGAERRLTILGVGDVLGEVGMFEGAPHETAARALTSCTLLRIDPATFFSLVRQRPEIAGHMVRRLGRRLVEALESPVVPSATSEPASEPEDEAEEPAEGAPMTQPRPRTRRSTREVPATTEREARLVDKGPGGSPISYTLGRLTTIGRTLRNTIVIPAPDVSRSHARIELTADGFLLSDLGSQNGTFVNGERIKEQVLKPGDQVRIGDQATFVFVMGGPDEDQGNPRG